ncbi:hypothetical protein GCM10007938_41380 [Vibrio zhanjiangensis]|uniref:LysM domain-containing protein n=1 Tax=Vibrio zhanjiangensis TaxID=1046128 RepID=A0ABQ6F520_9VIBR|nr:LysM domain-containing protein [Vibrio zhanjiangensis]GLT20354.1 hypothetical protein GCM10007938_41380 [Vibrio zhanjiangensis]
MKNNRLFSIPLLLILFVSGCVSYDDLITQQNQNLTDHENQKTQYESDLTLMKQQHQEEMQRMQAQLDEQQTKMKETKERVGQYVVEKGDWLITIAQAHNMTLEEIVRINPQIRDINKLYVGDVINIHK